MCSGMGIILGSGRMCNNNDMWWDGREWTGRNNIGRGSTALIWYIIWECLDVEISRVFEGEYLINSGWNVWREKTLDCEVPRMSRFYASKGGHRLRVHINWWPLIPSGACITSDRHGETFKENATEIKTYETWSIISLTKGRHFKVIFVVLESS